MIVFVAFTVYVFTFILYRLAVLPLPKAHRLALERSHYRLLWGGLRPMIRRRATGVWVCLIWKTCIRGLILDGGRGVETKDESDFFSSPVRPKTEGRHKPMGKTPFVRECRVALSNLPWSSDLSQPRKELYRELVVSSTSDPVSPMRGWMVEEIWVHWNWAPGSRFLNSTEFSLTMRLARNALPLLGLNVRAGLADMPHCARCSSGLEGTAEHAFYYCERVRPFWDHIGEWTACIEHE